MRIAFVGPFGLSPKSSMSVRALPLARALAQRGHKVALFMPPFHTPAEGGKSWREAGVLIENVRVSTLPVLGYAITSWRLAQRALAWRPDVVHCFKPKAYSGLAQCLLWWRRKLGRPFGLVLDSDDWEGWGGWNELEFYPRWQKHFFAWQEKWGLTHADAITVASRALETIVWSLGPDPAHVVYLPNGPGQMPVSALAGKKAAKPAVLLYSRFFEFDVARAIGLFQAVREQVPTAELLVVGKGLFGEEERLLAAARQAGLHSAVHYQGWAPAEELPSHFAAAHCAIYPFDDNLINRTKCAVKLADLLAAGVPVVAEAVGQNCEYIQHGRSGLLVPPGDDDAFAQAVAKVLMDKELQAKLSAGARQRIEDHFNWDYLAGQLERAYHAK